ncbi:unnamed protein product [Rotaria magnacalcarata]|uniref:XPG-I domain-containing protein n=2 Tax=Rotaria magnacalcarata TaxID=392030 RepID=A0A819Q9K2_9BILA|nr:unnamed protein product [Rotaria magnacalcarata]
MFPSSSDHTVNIPDIPLQQANEKLIPGKILDSSTTLIPLLSPQTARVKRRHCFVLILIFIFSILSLTTLYILFPKIDDTDKAALKIPTTIEEAKSLGNVLYKYSKHHRYIIMIAFFLTYIFLQTFAIPGSIFLSILAGFLYPFPLALFLVCLCSSLGASFCYLLSQLFGRHILLKCFHDRITLWQMTVQANAGSLLWLIIFLRITPILPNWFINICSPILDVPLGLFFAGTFAGVALPSILFIQAGKTLHQLSSPSDMGVKHLWSILEPACKQGSYEDLSGKTAAVDLSIWIIESRSVSTSNHRNSLHLRTLFFRVLNMIYFNIKPIFVLDSTKITELKLDVVAKRSGSTHTQTTKTRSTFDVLVNECKDLLTYLGLPIIRADGEAEKLCAQLNRMNIVDVVISNDSDCFVYGAKTIIRNFGIDMKSISFDIYDRHEIESNCHLDQRSLLALALILGSDYDSQGIQGIGRGNALKFLQSIPANMDPVDYIRTVLLRNNPQNKYEQKILNVLKDNKKSLKHFDKIINEYSSLELDNLPLVASIASIKWLKPVKLEELQSYMKKKLDWIESYTFIKVFPLLTRFQILYRLNMLELDVNDILSLSDTINFQPISIKRIRIRQSKQYYEIEWKKNELPSMEAVEDRLANLSIMAVDNVDDDEEDEKLITIEPADLFRHAYPDIVNRFEAPASKSKKPKKPAAAILNNENKPIIKKKKMKQPSAAASTSMSLDLLSMIENETCEIPITKTIAKKKNSKFNHRPTMAALSTSINIDVLSAIQKSIGNLSALKKSKSRPIKHHTQSDMVIHTQKPVTLLNTSLSLDVLDILLREKQQLNDDNCEIADIFIKKPLKQKQNKNTNNIFQLSSSDNTDGGDDDDDNKNVLPLPLWDRIRQRAAVKSI